MEETFIALYILSSVWSKHLGLENSQFKHNVLE